MNLFRKTVSLAVLAAIGCAPGFTGNSDIDPTLYPEPTRNAITFWGHATSYIDIDGYGILTDPVFEKSYSPFHARRIPAPPPEAYDQTSLILISHAHRDHLHPNTLKRFSKDVLVLCPAPSEDHIKDAGLTAKVMVPGDEFVFPGGTVVAVSAYHPGGRNSTSSDDDGRALGYVIHARGRSIYYTGDTEYYRDISVVRAEHRPDIVIMNINAHLESYDAMFAIAALGNPTVIPSHFGAYRGSNSRARDERLEELEELVGDVIVRLEVGESYPVEERDSGVEPMTPVP